MIAGIMLMNYSIELETIHSGLAAAALHVGEQGRRNCEHVPAPRRQRASQLTQLIVLRRGFVLTESCGGFELLFAVQAVAVALLSPQTSCLGLRIICLRRTKGMDEVPKMIFQALLRAELAIVADGTDKVLYMGRCTLVGSESVGT